VLERLRARERRNFRLQQRRLDANGLRLRIIENPLDEPRLLEHLVALDSQKRVRGTPSQPFIARYQEVFAGLFQTLGSRGWIYVAYLDRGEQPVAYELGFRCGRKLWGFLTAYDGAFAQLSPGAMLIPALVAYASSGGYDEYDFLRGREPYKMRWATDAHQTYRLQIWSRRWRSRVRAFVYFDARKAVYRLLGKAA
jgi:CelD/BcsL family acetyltransferase involved in cellulose biosynthesis